MSNKLQPSSKLYLTSVIGYHFSDKTNHTKSFLYTNVVLHTEHETFPMFKFELDLLLINIVVCNTSVCYFTKPLTAWRGRERNQTLFIILHFIEMKSRLSMVFAIYSIVASYQFTRYITSVDRKLTHIWESNHVTCISWTLSIIHATAPCRANQRL